MTVRISLVDLKKELSDTPFCPISRRNCANHSFCLPNRRMGGFPGNIHEAEFVPIPARNRLPINSTTSSTPRARTPIRYNRERTESSECVHICDLHPSTDPSIALDETVAPEERGVTPEPMLSMVHNWSHTHSILCVIAAPSKGLLICGTQDSKVLIFDIATFSLKHTISGSLHGSVLCLAVDRDENFLFSAGLDSLVRVWNLTPLADTLKSHYEVPCTHLVYSLVDIGDIFSIQWFDDLQTLFIGLQNALVLWCHLNLRQMSLANRFECNDSKTFERLPYIRFDRFFDSKGPGGSVNRAQEDHRLQCSYETSNEGPVLIEIPYRDCIRFAHNGYVYCMESIDKQNAPEFCDLHLLRYSHVLASCGGDGIIKLWEIEVIADDRILLKSIAELDNNIAILSMHIADSSIYVGLSDSTINVWDLTTFQLTRSFHFISDQGRNDEVLSLSIVNDCIYKATNMGGLCKFPLKQDLSDDTNNDTSTNLISVNFDRLFTDGSLNEKNSSVFTVHTFLLHDSVYLVSGGTGSLCLWNLSSNQELEEDENYLISRHFLSDSSNEHMLDSLKQFMSYKTISKYPHLYLDDSRRCAKFMSKLFMNLGAEETRLLPVPNSNPIVYAKFKASKKDENKVATRVLWYGHYDVVEATQDKECWDTDPFSLVAKEGNLYGRGVSDNKGPTLGAMYAVAQLCKEGELSTDVVFVIEGEEESGSIGFQDVIRNNKELIGPIDWIMLSNSYWLGDEIPCLNYGLRGVIHASISVESMKPDRHSGVDGGVSREPTMDLIHTLSHLTCPQSKKILIPDFYDKVLPVDETELVLYEKLQRSAQGSDILQEDLDSLLTKWRNPSLTVHRVDVSGPKNNTVISQKATASVSIRIVPNQSLEKIKALFTNYLNSVFKTLGTENELKVNIFHEAEPWLGDPNNLVYKVLFEKMKANWGPEVPEPLFIREGGSIPSIRFLEKEFGAPAAQIPCGQGSDNAHLKNEKLRIINLFMLRGILQDTFRELGLKT